MEDVCVTSPVFTNMTISACPACMLFLLQERLIDQPHPNLVVPRHGSHHSLSYPLPCPPLPLSPQKATPHRVSWRRRKQLPSVGSRWTASPFASLLVFVFLLESFTAKPFCAHVCVCKYCTLSSYAFHLSISDLGNLVVK